MSVLLFAFLVIQMTCSWTIIGYWPPAVRVCGFWSLPAEWQFSCARCAEISSLISWRQLNAGENLCPGHAKINSFLDSSAEDLIFISLGSVGRRVSAWMLVCLFLNHLVVAWCYRCLAWCTFLLYSFICWLYKISQWKSLHIIFLK